MGGLLPGIVCFYELHSFFKSNSKFNSYQPCPISLYSFRFCWMIWARIPICVFLQKLGGSLSWTFIFEGKGKGQADDRLGINSISVELHNTSGPSSAGGLVCAPLWSARAHTGCGREDATDQQRGDSLGSNTQALGTPQGFSVSGVTMVRADH